jgi:hypothetical protein
LLSGVAGSLTFMGRLALTQYIRRRRFLRTVEQRLADHDNVYCYPGVPPACVEILSTAAHRETLLGAHMEPVWRGEAGPGHDAGDGPSWYQVVARLRRAASCFLVCSARKLWPVVSTKCAPWGSDRGPPRRARLAEEVSPLGAVAIRVEENRAAFIALVDAC